MVCLHGTQDMATSCLVWCGVLIRLVMSGRVDNVNAPVEYCNMETFNATCQPNQVILMESAKYGRMHIGRCVQGSYGHLGCSRNVLSYLDTKCSGSRSCSFTVPGPDIYNTEPCSKEFTSYLEASYKCVTVSPKDIRQCHRHTPTILRNSMGVLSSSFTQDTEVGGSRCPWVIEVNPGQRINITLLNFARSYTLPTSGKTNKMARDTCFEVAKITEGATEKRSVSACGQDRREKLVYMSKTNTVTVEINRGRNVNFLLKYKAVSCPDIRPPHKAKATRDEDKLTIRCTDTQETWYLQCREDTWVGEIGNCSSSPPVSNTDANWSLTHVFSEDEIFPYGILFVVAIGVLLGIVIGGVLLGVIFILSKRSRKRREQHVYKENKENMRIFDANNSNNGALGSTTIPHWIREGQYTDEGIVRDIVGLRSPRLMRDMPPDDLVEHQLITADDHHLHTNQHVCDIIPTSDKVINYNPRSHLYESPSMS